MKQATITCARCRQPRANYARGLCRTCYSEAKDNSHLDDYQTKRQRRIENMIATFNECRQIDLQILVDDMGYTDNPLALARQLNRWAADIETLYDRRRHE